MGDCLDCDGDMATDTASMETIKLHWNSTISTLHARYMCLDIKNMYLNTKLPQPQYMRFHISVIPEEVIIHYKLREKMDAIGWVYVRIKMLFMD